MHRYILPLPALVCVLPLAGQGPTQQDVVKKMAVDFYAWYVPMVHKNLKGPASDVAIQQKGALFSEKLIRALREDSEASKHSPGEIVGLDWDPFLDSQDPYDHYEIGAITNIGGIYQVKVFGLEGKKRESKPSVVARIGQENGKWVFLDFISPDGKGLLEALALLKKDRQVPPKR